MSHFTVVTKVLLVDVVVSSVSFLRFGATNGPTCQSTILESHCWTTANTATLCTRTQWLFPCEVPIVHLQHSYKQYNSGIQHFNSCISLYLRLRAPKAPDATADMGIHHFTYAIMPHTSKLYCFFFPFDVILEIGNKISLNPVRLVICV